LSDASPPDSLGSAERYAFLPEADTNNLLVAHAAPDYGIGTVGTCLCLYDVEGAYERWLQNILNIS